MLVSDLKGDREASSDAELEHALRTQYDGVNAFHLGHDDAYPLLIIMVNGELAWLYFLSSSEHAGYYSAGGAVPGLDPDGGTRFVYFGPQEEEHFNNQVIPFADALRAAKEFFATGNLPQCIDWRDPSL